MPMSRDRSAALSIPDLLNPDPGCEASKFSLEYSPGEVLPRIHGWSVLHPWAVGVVCQVVQDLFASLSALQNFVFACSRGRHSSGVDAFAKRFRLSVYTAEPFSRAQPQGSVCRLHGLRHDCYEISAQRLEVRFVAQSCGESLERPGLVVLATVEAPSDEILDTASQRAEQCGDGKGGGDDSELGLVADQGAEQRLQQHYAADVDDEERRRKRTVDEGAVDQDVHVEEAVPEHGDDQRDGDRQGEQPEHRDAEEIVDKPGPARGRQKRTRQVYARVSGTRPGDDEQDPLRLGALARARPTIAHRLRRQPDGPAQQHQQQERPEGRLERVYKAQRHTREQAPRQAIHGPAKRAQAGPAWHEAPVVEEQKEADRHK